MSVQNAGTLEVVMMSGIARLQQDMATHQKTVSGAMRNIEASVSQAKNVLASLGVGLGVGYFVTLIKGSIDAADHLQDLSKTTSIAVEQLAGLRVAAKQSGGDLDSIAQSINKLSQNMGKDAEKFKALGVSAKDPLEAFKQLSDIFVAIQDPQQRAAVMAAALGKSWAGAAPLLAEGGKRIGEIVEKGSALSGVTAEMARQSDEFNDKLVLLTGTGGLLTRVIGPLLPLLNTMADDMLDVQSKAAGMDSGFKPVLETFRALVIFGSDVSFVFQTIGKDMARAFENVQLIAKGDFAGSRALGALFKADAEAARKALDEYQKKIMGLGVAGAEPKDNWDLMGKQGGSAAAAAAAARAAAFLKEKAAVKEVESAYPGLIKALEEKLLLEKESTEVEKLMFALDHLRGDQYAKLTIAQLANLEATAHGVDIKFAAKKAVEDETKALMAYAEWLEKVQGELAAAIAEEDKIRGQAILTAGKMIEQMELETSLIGATNAEREIAIFLRQAEIDKIDSATIARGKEAIAAKHAAQEAHDSQVDMWKSVESAGHQAFLSIFDTSKSVLERIRDMLKTHLIDILYQVTFKKWIVQIVTSTSGAGVAQSAFGSTGGSGGMMNLLSAGNTVSNLYSGGLAFGQGFASTAFLPAAEAAAMIEAGTVGMAGAGMEAGALMTVGSAMPYVAIAVAAAYALGLFDTQTTVQGSGDARINPDGTLGGGVGQLHGGYNPAAVMGAATQAVQSFGATVAALGGTITQSFGLGIGQGGGGEYNVVADIAGRQLADQAGLDSAGMQLAATRAILAGLQQAADFPEYIKRIFAAIDASTATGEQINAAIQFATALRGLREQLSETRLPAQIAADQIVSLNTSLGVSAHTVEEWRVKFVAAIDAGVNPTTLPQWQALGVAIQTVSAIAAQAAADVAQAYRDAVGTRLSTMRSDEDALRSAYQSEMDLQNARVAAVQTAQGALRQAYQSQASALTDTVRKWQDAAASLRQYGLSLGISTAIGAGSYAAASRQFDDVSTRARLGDLTAVGQLQGVSEAFRAASEAKSGTRLDYLRDISKIQVVLADTAVVSDRQQNIALDSLDALKRQVSALISLDEGVTTVAQAIAALQTAQAAEAIGASALAVMTQQVSALITINSSVLTVAQAIASLQGAISGLVAGAGGGRVTGTPGTEQWLATSTGQSWVSGAGAVATLPTGAYAGNALIHGIDGSVFTISQAQDFIAGHISSGDLMDIYSAALATGTSLASVNALGNLPVGEAERWAASQGLPIFHSGTPFVQQTGPAIVHRGERITSAPANDELVPMLEKVLTAIEKLQRPAEITADATSRHKDLSEQTVFGDFTVRTTAVA